MSVGFLEKARAHWTPERVLKVTAGKKLILLPNEAPELLRAMSLLNNDASMSADSVRKFLQINHMLGLVKPVLDDLSERFSTVFIADLCCGKSYLSFAIAHYLKHIKAKSFRLLGLERREDLVKTSRSLAEKLGMSAELQFAEQSLDGKAIDMQAFFPHDVKEAQRPHLVVGLHACDVASDLVLATAIHSKADSFALAPCCQAELARKWSQADIPESSAYYSAFKTPNMRRELAAQYTDHMRFLLARARGYKVTSTEFVPSQHTNKNRLILGERKANFLEEARMEYEALCSALHDQRISLDELLST